MNVSQEHRTQTVQTLEVDTCQSDETGKSAPLNADTPPLSTERIITQLNGLHDLIRDGHARS
jgi:hypothetical protein